LYNVGILIILYGERTHTPKQRTDILLWLLEKCFH